MHPLLRALAALVTLACFCACSTFGPRTQTIIVSSDPPGAEVRFNGNAVGTTPLQAQVGRGDELLVEVSKPGYQTAYRNAQRRLSTLGIVDVIGGAIILLPFLGLLSSAAWEQDPATFGITLDPEGAPAR
jgi:hypothetical protein